VLPCVRGDVEDPFSIIGSLKGNGIVSWGILDEHRSLIAAIETAEALSKKKEEEAVVECAETCNDPTHNHDHSHNHSNEKECAETCNDPTHNHDHSHNHRNNVNEKECAETCNDPTHNHDHSHNHNNNDITTAQDRFGISSFVYKRRRPFHPIRFSMFLKSLGKLSINGVKELSATDTTKGTDNDERFLKAKKLLLRSKGFVWMATSGSAAYFMSHAGQYLELMIMGRWWADINKKEWPEGLEKEVVVDFDGTHGDRRQEIVFIGQFEDKKTSSLVNSSTRKTIEDILDACLLNDQEMIQYEKKVKFGDEVLKNEFVNNY
jgi:G3E family GTPase